MREIDRILQGTDEVEMYEQIIDPIWDKSMDGSRLELLTEAERNIIYAQRMKDSIYGGGINTMFYNTGSRFATTGLSALKAIGDTTAIRIIEQAIEAFPVNIPEDLEACRKIMESWPDENRTYRRWNKLDDDFYNNLGNLLSATIEYVKRNQSEFE